MNRFQKITASLDTSGKGLEIGPSHNPILPKRDGYDVETVDHLDQQGLIEKYRDHGIDLSRIEPVDYVWTGGSLLELVGDRQRYDWIVAAHVIEHVPDVVGFLQQCLALLKPDGVLSLVIPDRRYSFDYLRFPSSVGSLLQAHLEKRKRHSPGQLVD
jgi:predicted SAM-dependent methyltransferase